MSTQHRGGRLWAAAFALLLQVSGGPVAASGEIGEHGNDLQAHLDHYAEEVRWLIEQVDGIVGRYDRDGTAAAGADAVVDHWESVDVHGAIETNYVPIYASIWQGPIGVRQAIDAQAPLAEVRARQVELEQALWQGLGAVRLAAQYQREGRLAAEARVGESTSPVETLAEIRRRLDRVVAKVAERLPDEATDMVHDTYQNRFEGVEGLLIEQDAELVETLEVDFNVTLPQAIRDADDVASVRAVVQDMQAKLDRASDLLRQAERSRRSVF